MFFRRTRRERGTSAGIPTSVHLRFEALEIRCVLNYTLQLLHASDFEAGVPALQDAPAFSSVINALRNDPAYKNDTLTVSSGDNFIQGPFFTAGEDTSPATVAALGIPGRGRADMVMLNALGIQASVLGNHDFDLGPSGLRSIIQSQTRGGSTYEGALFPYLSSNLDFTNDPSLSGLFTPDGQQEASTIPGKIARSAVVTINGQKIGLVGATTPSLPTLASSIGGIAVGPSADDQFVWQKLAEDYIQPAVDALTATGINKVVLLTHLQQLTNDYDLVKYLHGVDIIVAGGSHQVLANPGDRLRVGDTPVNTYPAFLSGSPGSYVLGTNDFDGHSVAILNTGANYRYVGRFVATFDDSGYLLPNLIDPSVSKPYPTDAQGVIDTGNVPPDPRVVQVVDALKPVIYGKDGNVFGRSDVFLNGRFDSVRTEETNLGDLATDAVLAKARQYDPAAAVAIWDGGIFRDYIGYVDPADKNNVGPTQADPSATPPKPATWISQLDIENSLRYNNPITLVTLTAQQLLQTVEYAVAATAAGKFPGQFPQVSGLAFSFDPSLPAGSRVRSLALTDANGVVTDAILWDGAFAGDPNRPIRIAVPTYLAQEIVPGSGKGGDGYPLPSFQNANAALYDRRDLTGETEQTALESYLSARFRSVAYDQADTPVQQDERIQNLAYRSDTVMAKQKPVPEPAMPRQLLPGPGPQAGVTILAAGAAAGSSHVIIYTASGAPHLSFDAYGPTFTGGVRVATGDVNGDGVPDVVTAPGVGGGPHVKVFDGATGKELFGFMAYDPSFTGGVYVAVADLDGDGVDEIITGAGEGGGPHVRIFDGRTGALRAEFMAYDPNFRGGVTVAAADVDGDGLADILTGAGPGGSPLVRAFRGTDLAALWGFLAYAPSFTGGVFVAAGDLDGDGKSEIVTGAGASGAPVVRVFGRNLEDRGSFLAFEADFLGGVSVGTEDSNEDGRSEIMAGAGPGGAPVVGTFDGETFADLGRWLAGDPNGRAGVFVG